MRYLITGAQGFVGRHLAARLLRMPGDVEVFGIGRSAELLDCFTHWITMCGRRMRAPLPADLRIDRRRYRYQVVDIMDQGTLAAHIGACRPDVIFHLASGLWGDDPARLAATNIRGIVSLITAAGDADHAHARLVVGSSGAVYGAPDALPISEDAAARPLEIYGVTKLVAEHAALAAARSVRMAVVIGRIFNVVGAGADERHAPARFAQQIADLTREVAKELQVGNLDATRDFIDVRDVAEALIILAERGAAGEAYNIGTGIETKLSTIIERLAARTEMQPEIRRAHFRNTDIPRHVASIEKLRLLGYTTNVPLEESLTSMLDYYLRPIQAKALP